ncbi:MAG: hypothetical protein RLZZ70_484 [Candidatus Parcubacteria bacterium]
MVVKLMTRVAATRSELHVVAFVGTFGAGKTTTGLAFAAALAKAGYSQSDVTYVVNEVGGTPLFSSPHAEVVTLPNGCFTCQDEDELLAVLHTEAGKGTKVVILEGFGLVSGDEVQEFLLTAGYSYQIVAVLDVSGFIDNRRIYYGEDMLASHLRVATGIIHTKRQLYDSEWFDERPMDFTKLHAPGTPVCVTEDGQPSWPKTLTSAVLAKRTILPKAVHVCGHGCTDHHHNHNHDTDVSLVHGWRTFWLNLRDTVRLADLQRVMNPWVEKGVVRLKGVVDGKSFNVTPGQTNWNIAQASEGSYVVLYLDERRCSVAMIEGLVDLCRELPQPARSHQLLRIDTDPAATSAEIGRLLESFLGRKPLVSPYGGLITHPEEMQLLQQMTRRPAQARQWKLPVYTACLWYWVRSVDLLSEQTAGEEAVLCTNKRELGVSLAWWASEFWEKLPQDLQEAIYQSNPAVLTAEGVLALTQLRRDSFWREWQKLEHKRALAFQGSFTAEKEGFIAQANQHLKQLEATTLLIA